MKIFTSSLLPAALSFAVFSLSPALSQAKPPVVAKPVAREESNQAAAKARLVLLKFEAEWCMPCRMMKPIVAKVSEDFGNRIEVRTIDIDKNPEAATEYGVQALPTLVAVKNGRVVGKKVGYLGEKQLTKFVKKKL